MRADRLLSILLLLQVHGRLTARELAARLEVSERTIHRDMEALSTAGIPVMAERGSGGGWGLLEAYETNLTGLNQAEVQALFMAQPARLLADLGLRQAYDAALVKLLAALPSLSRGEAEQARHRIHVDPSGWFQLSENLSALPTLHTAIWSERRARLTYARADGETGERLVEPLGLVAKGGVWYLVARADGDLRTYRASRIAAVELTGERFERPADFDLAAYWQRSSDAFKAALPRYPATLRVQPGILPILRSARYKRVEREYPPDADGWIPVDVMFEVVEEATEFILRFGPQIQVLEPPELRDRVIAAAQAILALYTEPVPETQLP
jgi:predicted DNA-binding transcriptional regulator YafY